jgi:type VI secretion system secreted protein Hcp
MPIYMNFEGIEGQVTAVGFEKQIELESFQLGVNRHISTGGHGGNREAAAPSVSEVVITKSQDGASADLFKGALFGEGKKVVITFCKTSTDGKSMQTFLVVTMEHTLISSYSVSGHGGHGGGRPMESLALNFTKIEYKYVESDEKNKAAKPKIATWDLSKAKA